MILSVVMRRTAITNKDQWQERLQRVLPQIKEILQEQPGFVSVRYLWGVDGDGDMSSITAWRSTEDCRNYVRGGAAALVATLEDRFLPTAAHPYGTWWRKNYLLFEE